MATAPVSLGDTIHLDKDGKKVLGSTLWTATPVLVVCLRRPGCCKYKYYGARQLAHSPYHAQRAYHLILFLFFPPRSLLCSDTSFLLCAVLCREESMKIWAEREKFEAMGVKLVCVLHEWREKEVEAFHPAFWGGEIYFDEKKAFHAAVHGGKVKRGNVLDLLNPFSRAWKNMKRAKEGGTVKDSNLVGDGLTMGGVMIFKAGGDVEYIYPEATFGDHAPFDVLLEAAKKAAGK